MMMPDEESGVGAGGVDAIACFVDNAALSLACSK